MKGKNSEFKQAVIQQLKSMIVPMILLILIGAAIIFVITYQNAVEEAEIIKINAFEGDKTPLIMENDKLKFILDPTTTQFSIEVKETGKIWYSNPVDVANDTIALSAEKGKIRSTLNMVYSNSAGLETEFNNYDYSISRGVYEIEKGGDYIRVNYSIGDTDKVFTIPPVMKQARFEEWLDMMDNEERNIVKQYYKLYDINKLGKKDDKEQLLADYPILETEPIYVLRNTAKDSIKKKMETIFEGHGYTLEEYEENKALNNAEASSEKPIFNVNMIYKLDGDDLIVQVPLGEMEFKEEYPIYTLTILPMFGAGGKDDNGYLFVPEGGGALINFNNGKTAQSSYYANMYGWDMALSRDAVVHNTRAYFNVFGISHGMDSFLCYLEEGAPYAGVQADISGRFNSYNFVNAKYSISSREEYDVGSIANTRVFVYVEDLPNETLTQRYSFINSGSYVKMAEDYRSYLLNKYSDTMTAKIDTSTPVALEIVGAVDKKKQILGVPVRKPLALTSFSEAGDILTQLNSEGMTNISVKMTGWANGGVNQKVLNSVKPLSELGGKSQLKKFMTTASQLGVNVYLDGVTQYAYDSDIFDGFNSFTDAARFISKKRAELFVYSDVTYAAREGVDSYYLLHTSEAEKMTDNLAKAANSFGAGVSFRETGMDLSSDFYVKNPVSRQQSMDRQIEQVKSISDTSKVMVNMGNDYVIGYADMVTNMDLKGSKYTILDKFVPVYQMAIHGYVNYTGKAINISGAADEELLNSVEYGAGLFFNVMNETAFALQKTLYTEYYGSSYASCHDTMMDIYKRYNAELGHTFNQKITNHEYINSEMTCTTYEDGTKVYVNYGYSASPAQNGATVPARDYLVVRY